MPVAVDEEDGGVGHPPVDACLQGGVGGEATADVGEGGTWLDPEVVQQIFVRSRRRRTLEALTPREREVLSLMAQGRSNQAIADALGDKAGITRFGDAWIPMDETLVRVALLGLVVTLCAKLGWDLLQG